MSRSPCTPLQSSLAVSGMALLPLPHVEQRTRFSSGISLRLVFTESASQMLGSNVIKGRTYLRVPTSRPVCSSLFRGFPTRALLTGLFLWKLEVLPPHTHPTSRDRTHAAPAKPRCSARSQRAAFPRGCLWTRRAALASFGGFFVLISVSLVAPQPPKRN